MKSPEVPAGTQGATSATVTERVAMGAIRWLPKATFGKVVGFLSRTSVPRRMRPAVYGAFSKVYGAQPELAEFPVDAYRNFSAFFSRGLRQGVRNVDADPLTVVSPVDGRVVEHGDISSDRLLQAKGIDYTLQGLLIDESAARQFSKGTYATIYLAPGDYHRIHSPVAGRVVGYHHIPGARFPVNGPAVRNIPNIFCRNERVVTYLESALGDVAVIKVAAMGVGNIALSYDTIGKDSANRRVSYATGRQVQKGQELGAFLLGSTVIILFAKGRVALDRLEQDQRVLMGQRIGLKAVLGEAAA